ncbi:putative GTP-binding protein YjiA [Pigmentiphaga humi]|uniref:Putative GTP-binding protein YjiA n=1 Tax=Pigmentiphaga humi TaxID=2478468 RepID=A0A3P4AX31_9BURK|nr:GTP-binding protein [Pigmentiphaga humi]VCU68312.1 putative GTP-binding protein YjiA [Pigmentiphaga humi]
MTTPPRTRIPVFLLTGFLGSGKTTLLSSWLTQPALRGAAVIVNELGEVGLDGSLLGVASESALLAGNCVCCTGLPGLEQALEDLFWARLQRQVPAFHAVAIETTGLADPRPVIQAFEDHPLLRERYRLRAVLTVAGAPAGAGIIDRHSEARAQVQAAQALIVTKTDAAAPDRTQALEARLAGLNAAAPILMSHRADLPLDAVLAAIDAQHAGTAQETSAGCDPAACSEAHRHDCDHDHSHGHGRHAAQAHFVPLPQPVSRDWLEERVSALSRTLGEDLLRLKGVVTLADGARCVVQYAPDSEGFELIPADAAAAGQPAGLTVIAQHADARRATAALLGPDP